MTTLNAIDFLVDTKESAKIIFTQLFVDNAITKDEFLKAKEDWFAEWDVSSYETLANIWFIAWCDLIGVNSHRLITVNDIIG